MFLLRQGRASVKNQYLNSMKSICFVTTGDIKDIATAKRALGLANPLTDLGWQVSIIMEDTEENRHRVALECNSKVKVFYFSSTSALKERKLKGKIVKEIKPAVVYLCACVVRNMIFPLPKGCRLLIEHSELPSWVTPKSRLGRKILNYIEEYWSLFYADGLLLASKFLMQAYSERKKKIGRKRLPMLYFPYAFSRLSSYSYSVNDDFTLDKEEIKNLTYLGSLSKAYSTFSIVLAFEQYCKEKDNLRLLLLGKGEEYESIKQYITEKSLEGKVFMPGYVGEEDIEQYFSMTDMFILPMNDSVQDWARCPSKLYMYLQYKKAIITSKIGEPYYVLGDKGIYYEPNSIDSLKEAIAKAVQQTNILSDIDTSEYEWNRRAVQLDEWLKSFM